jgi:hypothetical protein
MDSRANRLSEIEIPLTLFNQQDVEFQCACLNISSTGALLRFLEANIPIKIGTMFRSKMFQQGELVEVWMQVERLSDEGVGVRFLKHNAAKADSAL